MAATEIDKEVAERLLSCNWLANCGIKGEIPGLRCEWETDKETVIKYINSNKFQYTWGNICLEEENEITSFLAANHRDEYNKSWNQFVEEVNEIVLPQIVPAITERIERLELPRKAVIDDIEFNVIGMAVTSYYKEYVRSPFFDNLLDIYCSGHLPYGWRGRHPRGVIRVY